MRLLARCSSGGVVAILCIVVAGCNDAHRQAQSADAADIHPATSAPADANEPELTLLASFTVPVPRVPVVPEAYRSVWNQDDLRHSVLFMDVSPDKTRMVAANQMVAVLYDFKTKEKAVLHNSMNSITPEDYRLTVLVDWYIDDIRFAGNAHVLWVVRWSPWVAQVKGIKTVSKCSPFVLEPPGFSPFIFDACVVACHVRGLGPVVRLRKYDLHTGRRVAESDIHPSIRGASHIVEAMALSPDQTKLAAAADTGLSLVQVDPFQLLQSYEIRRGRALAFSADGKLLAVGTLNDELYVVDTSDKSHLQKFTPKKFYTLGSASTVAFHGTSTLYYCGTQDLFRLDLVSGKAETVLAGCRPSCIRIDQSKERLFLGTNAGEVRIYRLASSVSSTRVKRCESAPPATRPGR